MNTNNHLTAGSHLSGLKVKARESDTIAATDASSVSDSGRPTTATSSMTNVVSQPSILSLAVNVDMYLRDHPSGVCFCTKYVIFISTTEAVTYQIELIR